MGQSEVYSYLKNIFLSGDVSFYSVREIYLNMGRSIGFKSIQLSCSKLYNKGRFIERKYYGKVPKYRCNRDLI